MKLQLKNWLTIPWKKALIDKGIHPIRIADGFKMAAKHAVDYLDNIAVFKERRTDQTFYLKKSSTKNPWSDPQSLEKKSWKKKLKLKKDQIEIGKKLP